MVRAVYLVMELTAWFVIAPFLTVSLRGEATIYGGRDAVVQ